MLNFLKVIGPGVVAASAAIGTSHLIQATRAGGYFGLELLWLVLLTNILKYPFIEHGFRYTAATGENMMHGYKKLNPKLLIAFIIVNIAVSFGAVAAVAYICGNIVTSILGIDLDVKLVTLFIIVICYLIIAIGHYRYLDKIMKLFMFILLVSTLVAFIVAIFNCNHNPSQIFYTDSAWSSIKYIPFLIALMGWMPGPIELSVWHSLWLEARNRNQEHKLNFKQSAIDFNVGYGLMLVTALLFLSLGGIVLHYSGQELSSDGVEFTSQFISIYIGTIGEWSSLIIMAAVMAAILSTTLAIIDIYPRTITEGFFILKKDKIDSFGYHRLRLIVMFVCCSLAIMAIMFFVDDFKILIDTVTIIAFLSAPLFAYMNFKLVNSDLLEKKFHPPKWMKMISYFGFVYLVGFSFIFLAHLVL